MLVTLEESTRVSAEIGPLFHLLTWGTKTSWHNGYHFLLLPLARWKQRETGFSCYATEQSAACSPKPDGDSGGVELQAPPRGAINEREPVTVVLQEKIWSLSGDSFRILDNNQREVLQVKGNVFSLREQKVLYDSHGKELGLILKKLLAFKAQEDIHTPDRRKNIASIAEKSFFQLKSNAEEIHIRGSCLARDLTFQLGGRTIAHVHRSLEESDSYLLTVAPNVDLAFMVLVTICLDEVFNDCYE
ncbi:hypothetical protein QOT17_000993 [Balamuthia mandrillaris]